MRAILAQVFLGRFGGPLPLYDYIEIEQIHKDVYSHLDYVLTERFNQSKTRNGYALICGPRFV